MQKELLSDLPNSQKLLTIEINTHHWLTTVVLQLHHFQNEFFQNLVLFRQTKKQIRIYAIFLRKLF